MKRRRYETRKDISRLKRLVRHFNRKIDKKQAKLYDTRHTYAWIKNKSKKIRSKYNITAKDFEEGHPLNFPLHPRRNEHESEESNEKGDDNWGSGSDGFADPLVEVPPAELAGPHPALSRPVSSGAGSGSVRVSVSNCTGNCKVSVNSSSGSR
jgi:hypothetical protein